MNKAHEQEAEKAFQSAREFTPVHFHYKDGYLDCFRGPSVTALVEALKYVADPKSSSIDCFYRAQRVLREWEGTE